MLVGRLSQLPRNITIEGLYLPSRPRKLTERLLCSGGVAISTRVRLLPSRTLIVKDDRVRRTLEALIVICH